MYRLPAKAAIVLLVGVAWGHAQKTDATDLKSAGGEVHPAPEMQKLYDAFLETWRYAEEALGFAFAYRSPALIEKTNTALRQIRLQDTRAASAKQVIVIPEGNHVVMVDGKLAPEEWDDAVQLSLGDKAHVYVKQSGGYVWMAIEYLPADNFTVDIYVQPADGSLYDLHSSAKIAERKLQGQSWSDDWTWWNNDRWVANWSRVDSFEQRRFLPQKVREYQLSRARFTGKTWRVMFELTVPAEPKWQTFTFPEGAKNTSTDHWVVLQFDR